MIFAAGLGTRLYPLTANKPKALVEYNGKTLLEHTLTKIIEAGIDNIVINVHHFGEQIIDFFNQNHFNVNINISDEREKLLDTAGGLKHAEHFLKEYDQILLYNVDVISSIDLNLLLTAHLKPLTSYLTPQTSHLPPHTSHLSPHTSYLTPHTSHLTPHTSNLKPHTSYLTPLTSYLTPHTSYLSPPTSHLSPLTSYLSPLATLAVRNRQTSRYFLFEEPELRLCGWKNISTEERIICYEVEKYSSLAFSGIHIVKKKILDFIPKNEKLSFTTLYLELAKNYHIQGYLHNEDTWKDLGKREDFN